MHRILIAGPGKPGKAAATALLDDYIEGLEDPRLLFVIDGDLPEIVDIVGEYAMTSGVPYEAYLAKGLDEEELGEFLESALRVHRLGDPYAAACKSLKSGDEMLLAWSDDDPICERLFEHACGQGLTVKDICDGLIELEAYGAEEDDDDIPEPSEVEAGDFHRTLQVDLSADPLEVAIRQLVDAIAGMVRAEVGSLRSDRKGARSNA